MHSIILMTKDISLSASQPFLFPLLRILFLSVPFFNLGPWFSLCPVVFTNKKGRNGGDSDDSGVGRICKYLGEGEP